MTPISATITITDLLLRLRNSDDVAHDATLILGLLLEGSEAGPSSDIAQVAGIDWASRRLSAAERREAISGLTAYLENLSEPTSHAVSAVWALGKSLHPDLVPTMINLIDRFLGHPDAHDLMLQAIQVIDLISRYGTAHRPAIRRALTTAAARGGGDVSTLAQQVLDDIDRS